MSRESNSTLERIGDLLRMSPLIARAGIAFKHFGTDAEILVEPDELAPDMRDIGRPMLGDSRRQVMVTEFYDALADRYRSELKVVDQVDVMPEREDHEERETPPGA